MINPAQGCFAFYKKILEELEVSPKQINYLTRFREELAQKSHSLEAQLGDLYIVKEKILKTIGSLQSVVDNMRSAFSPT